MVIKGKGRILVAIPEYYAIKNWDISKAEKVPAKTVDLTSWLLGKKLKRKGE